MTASLGPSAVATVDLVQRAMYGRENEDDQERNTWRQDVESEVKKMGYTWKEIVTVEVFQKLQDIKTSISRISIKTLETVLREFFLEGRSFLGGFSGIPV